MSIPALFHRYGRRGFWVFLALTLMVAAALVLLGDRPRWIARWPGPYRVEVCPGLLRAHGDAVEHIRTAYYHIHDAGHDLPTTIEPGPCVGDDPPQGVVRWDIYALAPGIGHGISRLDYDAGELDRVTVLLRMGEDPDPSLYRHEAWHTIGADHPWLPSSGHVLHPSGVDGVWGDSTRGYRR